MDISRLTIDGTEHTLKDAVARGEEAESENSISAIEIGGVVYDVKDIVARGEGSGTSVEISKIEVGGKVCQIKDVVAREKKDYFAVYSEDDSSLTFYGDNTVPDAGTQYGGKTATNVYTGVEDTGSSNPPWYSSRSTVKSVKIDASFSGARPTSCYRWFRNFYNCTAIDELGNVNTSAVTTMYSMFDGCSSLTTLDASNWDTSAVTDMSYMFYSCSLLTTLDVSNFDTSSVTSMDCMFEYCSSLTTLDVSNFDTSSVITMQEMFYGCSSLTTLDVSGFDTSSVTDMSYMFCDCTSITTIYSDDTKFTTTAVTASTYMFLNCTALVGGNGTTYDSSKIDATMAHIDTPDNPGYFTEAIK